jgi:hypothetical protein
VKRTLKPWKHPYLARLGVLLIAIALIVGTLSCVAGGGVKYTLTMAANPGAGGTAADLTGGSPYASGTTVNIKAVANPGYKFVNWSAPAGTFGSATAATTTFKMPAQNVTVTANFVKVYSLTMAVNPAGGGTATDLTGGSPYPAGTAVNIKAVANAPYQFVNWAAPAGAFGNSSAAQTTFTMPAQNVTVTAMFVGPLDHFTWYQVDSEWYVGENVTLEDQFGTFNATVGYAFAFDNPAGKSHDGNVTQMWNPDHHFTFYSISYKEQPVFRSVEVKNQFGIQNLTVCGPVGLLVPTWKLEPGDHKPPVALDHYLLYEAIGSPVNVTINLNDEFGNQTEVEVRTPVGFATPVQKTNSEAVVTEILNPNVHFVMYDIYNQQSFNNTVQVDNQFGEQALNVSGPYYLSVPSDKIVPPAPPPDHFKCYDVVGAPPLVDTYVDVWDQFYEYDFVQVNYADWFCNPVMKNSEPIVNPDNHLTVYNITPDYQTYWQVDVDNQFGPQSLIVWGPVALAAPTWKLAPNLHGPPKYLDHYLLYEVIDFSPVGAVVDLDDEFPDYAEGVSVTEPVYFANPVLLKYNYSSGDVTGVWNPEAHLVFYAISENFEFFPSVVINDQFEVESTLSLVPIELLAVPSVKVHFEEFSP